VKTKSYKINSWGRNRLCEEQSPRGVHVMGHVVCDQGVVAVNGWRGKGSAKFDYTQLTFVAKERVHLRTFDGNVSQRRVVAEAKKFAEEMSR